MITSNPTDQFLHDGKRDNPTLHTSLQDSTTQLWSILTKNIWLKSTEAYRSNYWLSGNGIWKPVKQHHKEVISKKKRALQDEQFISFNDYTGKRVKAKLKKEGTL